MKFRSRGVLKFIFSISISLLIGWWAYYQSGSPEYGYELRQIDWYKIPLLSAVVILGGLMRSWRLGQIFRPSYGQMRKTVKVLFFSISFSFLLGGIGFLIRLLLLRRGIGARHVVSLGLIGLEKLIDLLLAFIVFFFLFNIPHADNPLINWINANKIIISIPLFAGLIWFYFRQGIVFRWFLSIFRFLIQLFHLPLGYYYYGKRQIFYLYKSLGSLPPKRILIFVIHSLMVVALESSFFYFGLLGLGVDLDYSQALLLNAVIILALLIPIFPSGIGLFQAAMVFVVERNNIFYISLLIHFILIITHLVIMSLGFYQTLNLFGLPVTRSGNDKSDKRDRGEGGIEPDRSSKSP